jgi:pyruvate ferredoxin oxidoreductase alpha subunit
MALLGTDSVVIDVVAGLGGRPITRLSLEELFATAMRGQLGALTFLDLDVDVVAREVARVGAERHSGPSALNVLRDVAATRVGQSR